MFFFKHAIFARSEKNNFTERFIGDAPISQIQSACMLHVPKGMLPSAMPSRGTSRFKASTMGTAASKPTIGKTAVGPPQLPGLVDLVTGGDLPTDVVLVASDGAKVGAHSFICASISPVMKAALVGNFQESTSKKINADYASAATIEKMLSFAIGTLVEKDISGDDAIDLVILADRLDYE